MPLDKDQLRGLILRCADRIEAAARELNELDGRLGDGDLGATLQKCAVNLRGTLAEPQVDIAGVFKAAAIACTKASGSSFGTLLAVACMTATKATAERASLGAADAAPLLSAILEALMARGGASLGDKTVLDPLAAVRDALAGIEDGAVIRERTLEAVEATLSAFRDKPNRIGRARMFAERSVGLDDPGMVAFRHLADAATG